MKDASGHICAPGDWTVKGVNRRAMLRAELESFLREKLDAALSVELFDTESSKDVFRAVRGDGGLMFVKVVRSEQAVRLKALSEKLAQPFVAKVYCVFPWRDGWCVVCMEWQSGRHIPLEDLNEGQLQSLADVHLRLVAALKPELELLPPKDYAEVYDTIADFARRHPLARPLLKPLLSIPPADRIAPAERLCSIHGDFHYLNYLFEGDEISAVMDFDKVRRDLPAWDIAYNLLRRYYKGRLDAAKTQALDENVRRLVSLLPYSGQDWKVALNDIRLLFAARRLKAHPKSFWTAFLVRSRDKALRRVVERVLP